MLLQSYSFFVVTFSDYLYYYVNKYIPKSYNLLLNTCTSVLSYEFCIDALYHE